MTVETKGEERGVNDVVKSPRTYPETYLRSDERPTTGPLLEKSEVYLGSDEISFDRFIDPAYHDLEMKAVWSKTWQVAAHESELADVGDTVVYNIGKWSILVVRSSETELRAYYNSCLHRGTMLKECDGPVAEFRCPFHGWTFGLDGQLTYLPEAWDFARIDQDKTRLPQVKVDIWAGWVFVNLDPDAVPLEEYLGPLRKQYEAIPPAKRYVATHAVIHNIPANWKVTQDAFFEVYHCDPTHPQLLVSSNCYDAENSVYLDGGHMNTRMIVPIAVPGAGGHFQVTEQDVIDSLYYDRVRGQAALGALGASAEAPQLGVGELARPVAAKMIRKLKEAAFGASLDGASDGEVLDAIEFSVFPNFMPWAGYQNVMSYRFRPDGNSHNRSIMDVWLLNPVMEGDLGAVPHAPEPVYIDATDGVSDVPALGRFTVVLQQDLDNLPLVQRGMETSALSGMQLADYQEVRMRAFHQMLDDYIARASADN